METREILFALLRSEIMGEAVVEETFASLTLERAAALLRLAKAHDLAHIVAAALMRTGVLGVEQTEDAETEKKRVLLLSQCEREQMIAVYRYEGLRYALAEIGRVLSDAGIAHMPLKGSVLRDYYPEPWHRSSCDIDMLVREEDLERACKALCEGAGYRVEGQKSIHDVHLYSPAGVHLELHFNILSGNDTYDVVLSRVWDFSSQNENNSCHFTQKDKFFVLHHIAHMAYHFTSGGCGIKPFIDLFIMQTRMHPDFDGARELLSEAGLLTFSEQVLSLSRVWFMGGAHTDLTKRMEEYLLSGGVYGTVDNRVLAQQGKKGGKLRYALSRIFLPYSSLCRTYPVLERHKWLLPFMQVRRWCRLVFCGGLGRGVHELSVNQGITKEQASEMERFRSQLGI